MVWVFSILSLTCPFSAVIFDPVTEFIVVSASLIHPVILSGGVGSRLWPLSRSLNPKQLLPLVGDRTMIQETALRVSGSQFAAPLII
jgi:hypothetical protein